MSLSPDVQAEVNLLRTEYHLKLEAGIQDDDAAKHWIKTQIQAMTLDELKSGFANLANAQLQQRKFNLPEKGSSEYTLLGMIRDYGTPQQKILSQQYTKHRERLQQFSTELINIELKERKALYPMSKDRIRNFKEARLSQFELLDGPELNAYIKDNLQKKTLEQLQTGYLNLKNDESKKQFIKTVRELGTEQQQIWAETVIFLRENLFNLSRVKDFYETLALPGASPNHQQKGKPDTAEFLKYAQLFGEDPQQRWAERESTNHPEKSRDISIRKLSISSDDEISIENATVVTPVSLANVSEVELPLDPDMLQIETDDEMSPKSEDNDADSPRYK